MRHTRLGGRAQIAGQGDLESASESEVVDRRDRDQRQPIQPPQEG
jgi:hypothetical protein